MRKEGCYQYQVLYRVSLQPHNPWKGWVYEIYTLDLPPQLVRECSEWFDSEVQARFAAVGHIALLENGEG